MSEIKGKVGKWDLTFKSVPRGAAGSTHIEVENAGKKELIEVRWRRDADGIWIETPRGVFGFDLDGEMTDDARIAYRAMERSTDGHWAGLSFMRAGDAVSAAAAGGAKKGVRVRAQMPGKILRVLVAEGAAVEKDQAIVVMEAMKMENEIRAPQAGKIGKVRVNEGQAVETGADLCLIDSV